MSFLRQLQQYPPAEWRERILSTTPQMIDRVLCRPRLTLEGFASLLSPGIRDAQLEQLALKARRLTWQRFGRTIQLYAPLYLSNECTNGCRYCGFSADNELPRRTLSLDAIQENARFLRDQGFRHLLLLTGEAPDVAGIDYLVAAVRRVRSLCGSVAIEVFPMDKEGYARMVAAGVDGLTLYQETYEPELYGELHPYGQKSDYRFRLRAPEAAGEAGLRRIGIGALLGLGDCLTDVFYTGLHARYLTRRFWRTQVTISFPRLRPAAGGFQPRTPVSDRQLAQFICALRLLCPDAGLILSTRESAALRDNLLPLGITQMSAGSCTAPGGYVDGDRSTEQFAIDDDRPPAQIVALLRAKGYDPVFKDWDRAFLDGQAGAP